MLIYSLSKTSILSAFWIITKCWQLLQCIIIENATRSVINSSLIFAPGSTLGRWISSLILNENKRQNLFSSSPFSVLLILKSSLMICCIFTSTARKDQSWHLNPSIHRLSFLLEVLPSNTCNPEPLNKYTFSLTHSSPYLVKPHSFIMLCIPKPHPSHHTLASYMHKIQMERNGNGRERNMS